MIKIKLQKVHYMPKQLEPGILYVSYEYATAAHLCACGCGSKIRTPLGSSEWSIIETINGPSLWPSIGNWQLACKSHYIIEDGEIQWANKWSEKQIQSGRAKEQKKRKAYYESLQTTDENSMTKILGWIHKVFK